MRLPWIQVEKSGIAQCRVLARLLAIPEAQGIGLGLMLWEWALEIAEDGDFSGNVPDAEILAASLMWPVEDSARLVTQLQRVGMLATHPQLRVRGLDRYRRAWEKNTRKNINTLKSGGRVPETGANPAPVAPKPARKTETETDTKESAAVAPVLPVVPEPKKPKVRTGDPRHIPLIAKLTEVFRVDRGWSYPFDGGRDAKAVANLLAKAEPDAIAAAWGRALAHSGFPSVSTLSELNTHLARFLGASVAAPTTAEHRPARLL